MRCNPPPKSPEASITRADALYEALAFADAEILLDKLSPYIFGCGRPDDTVWRSRSYALLRGALAVLVHLRDQEGYMLDLQTLRDVMASRHFDALDVLAWSDAVPDMVASDLRAVLLGLPGYSRGSIGAQTGVTSRRYGAIAVRIQVGLYRLSTALSAARQ